MTTMAWLGVDYSTPIVPPMLDQERTDTRLLSAKNVTTDVGKSRWYLSIRFIDNGDKGFQRKYTSHKNRVGPGSFAIVCPQLLGTVGVDGEMYEEDDTHGDALLETKANAAAGASTVRVGRNSGITDNIALRTGRFIRFDGETPIYQVVSTDDAVFSGATQTISIVPNLRKAVAANTDIHLNPNITVRLPVEELDAEDPIVDGIIYDRTIGFYEALP